MTGPAFGGTGRGTGAPSRATGTRETVGAVLLVLAAGLALRLIIAQLIPGSGFDVDIAAFRAWMSDLAAHGPYGFYDRPFFHDYTPGYLLGLWFMGTLGNVLHWSTWIDAAPWARFLTDLDLKALPILADLVIGWLVHSMVLELGGRRRLALAAAAIAVLNPISWFDSVVWGQVDSVGVVFLLLALREIWRDRPERAAIFAVIAAIIKPQLGILLPIVAIVTIRRALWPAEGTGGRGTTGRPIRILTTALAGFLAAEALCLPFGLSVVSFSGQAPFISSGLLEQIAKAAGGYPYLTVNAYNLWAIVPGSAGNSLASSSAWICDYVGTVQQCGAGSATIAGIPAVLIGTVLLLASIVLVLWVVARRPDRLTVLVGLAVLALAFFAVPTRVHERYGYPFFAVAVILAAVSWRWRWAYVTLAAATFANMYVVLTTLYPDNPSVMDWLGIGGAIRSPAGVTIVAIVHSAAFAWVFLQLRRDSHRKLDGELALASGSPRDVDRTGASDDVPAEPDRSGPPVPTDAGSYAEPDAAPLEAYETVPDEDRPASIRLPTWTARPGLGELGLVGWFRSRLGDGPIRPDRSALLARERGGRLDRLDLWLLVVLVVGSLLFRTFRLAEPYQMHFDEVYHARTATEFLQDWRYGLSHDIYEWTHPHLAKYAMAAGLVLWGEDHVDATSDLGVTVRDAVIEPRRADPQAPGGQAGDRLHVATGSEIRTYDLATRALISVVPAPGVGTLAFDSLGRQLVLGYDDGRIATLDATTLGAVAVDLGPTPSTVVKLDHPVQHLLLTADGTSVVAASGERLSVVDLQAGTVTGSLDLPAIADLAVGGSGSALVATVADVPDPSTAASTLAGILGGEAASYLAKLTGPTSGASVVLGSPGSGDARTALDKAIADGRLPGIGVEDVPRVAVATSGGVAFIDPARVSLITTMPLDGGARGLAAVNGLDNPRLYATTGQPDSPGYEVFAIGGDAARDSPVDQGKHPLPAPGTRIVYDDASQMVHILGRIPGSTGSDGDPWTVYVIEPHANAVYADARLPVGFTPAAWAADIAADYPSADRQQLLVFDGSGASASIAIGSHAFAWRLPGVIAGALTAGLLFLLARILFRRRIVAVLTGLFVLADGMFFVQARIGMNDVYVGLFIIAAYTLFAAIWTGWWRGRLAFWLGMPIVGLLLGLALASKWVAAYAIGALVLLILVRSALGRVLAILGMIGLTGRTRLHGDQRARRPGVREPDVPADHDRPDPPGRGGRHPPPDRLDRRRAPVRGPCPDGPRDVAVLRDAGSRAAADRLCGRPAVGHAAAPGDRTGPRLAGRGRALLPRRSRRVRAAGPAAGAGRPDPPSRPAGTRAGRMAATRHDARTARAVGGRLSDPASAGGLRDLVHPLGDGGGPPNRLGLGAALGRLATGAHRSDAARPDGPDVPLPQRPDRGTPGVVTVVGLAARSQAGLVLPGRPRRLHVRLDLRRRQSRHLVAGRSGHGLRRVHGVPAPQPRARLDRRRVRRTVDLLGADRPGGLPIPLLHGAPLRGPRPRVLHRRAVARCVAPHLAPRPGRGGDRRAPARPPLGPVPTTVRVRRVSLAGSQACPAYIPDFVLTSRTAGLSDRGRDRTDLRSSCDSWNSTTAEAEAAGTR